VQTLFVTVLLPIASCSEHPTAFSAPFLAAPEGSLPKESPKAEKKDSYGETMCGGLQGWIIPDVFCGITEYVIFQSCVEKMVPP